MSNVINLEQVLASGETFLLVDVRKTPARHESGLTIRGALPRRPFAAEDWWREFAGRRVVVFCVHGHAVSQAVAGFLADNGIDAHYLEGGFEAWRAAGQPVEPLAQPW